MLTVQAMVLALRSFRRGLTDETFDALADELERAQKEAK